MMYPLAISEYSDSELIYLMNMCNELEVYSLHIVDSFGSMKSKNVIKYISMMKQYLDEKYYNRISFFIIICSYHFRMQQFY